MRRLALALFLVAGCSATPDKRPGGYYKDDGPGDGGKLASIPDAVPRNEPLHRWANRPYEALGKRYVPLARVGPFEQRGTASWYGKRFHGKPTSSGEPYDMYQMTAAHKTLPLPTYVRVTRKSNGRSVVVKVNERGPFHTGRVIDLSYAAASRLDLLKEGSAEVEVEALDPGAPAALAPPKPFLELAATDDPIYAVAVREDASGLGVGVEIRTFEQGEDVVYRVLPGPFRDGASLESARRQLQAASLDVKPVAQ